MQASGVSEEILKTEYDSVRLLYTSFKSAISFKPTIATILSPETLEKSDKIADKLDQYEVEGPDRAELLQDMGEYQLACMMFYAMNEACTSEHASRMQVRSLPAQSTVVLVSSAQAVSEGPTASCCRYGCLATHNLEDSAILQPPSTAHFCSLVRLHTSICTHQSFVFVQAMENSSKNSAEMIEKLTLTFNRTRQAKVTTELNEIISGALSLEDADK